ncbi:hypothetical protein FRB90_007940 [Tulasnella sp. 427]|nr:hypothetical protein FRB90_007940 [Tulasnella sp. 427]
MSSLAPIPNTQQRRPLCTRRTTIGVIPPSPEPIQSRTSDGSLPSYRSSENGVHDDHFLRVPIHAATPVTRRQSPLERLAQATADNYTSMPLHRRATRLVEEGRDSPSSHPGQGRPGVLASIMDLYTSQRNNKNGEEYNHSRRKPTPYPTSVVSSRVNSVDTAVHPSWGRSLSIMSTETDHGMLFDENDPRITGIKNRIDDKMMKELDEERLDEHDGRDDGLTREQREERATIERNLRLLISKQNFILKLAQALMLYGAPSHRLESQLAATGKVLSVPLQVIHFPGFVLISFHDKIAKTSETHIVKATTRLQLGKLHRVHMIYRSVVHSQIGVKEGTEQLSKLIKAPTEYSVRMRCLFAFCCAFVICLSSFGGSFLDAGVAGCAAAGLAYLQLHAVKRSVLFANIFDGFSLTVGSDFWFLLDTDARTRRQAAADSLTTFSYVNGTLIPDSNSTDAYNGLRQALGVDLDGSWMFVNKTSNVSKAYHYQIVGCYRDPTWEWWRRPLPLWSLFILVPLYSLFNSFWHLQPWRSKQLPVMVSISCISYAARKSLQHYVGPRNEVVSAMGAFVIGVLGNVYARVFKGTAFTCMVTAVCFLVPSGLAAAGGLAMNYQGTNHDQYTSSIVIGVRMLSVAIGTTVGLLFSSLVVYAFGPQKKSALFAF